MGYLLYILTGFLLTAVVALLLKIFLMRKSMKEISGQLHDRLTEDTNVLIDVSSHDPYLLKMTDEINAHLRLLRKDRQKYQQGDMDLKEAVANLSHDLRTPLTAVSGYLDLLEQEEKSSAAERYLSRIRNRTDAMKNLTHELFRYSLASSARTLKKERIDLVRELEESLLSFYGVLKERGIDPEIQLPDKPVWKELDRNAVSRIFSNIISNALKYSDRDLSVRMTDDGDMTFANSAVNLDAVAVGKLFDRFFSVETGQNSTGLGLSIAKTLTVRMGGSIDAEYHEGRLYIHLSFGEKEI